MNKLFSIVALLLILIVGCEFENAEFNTGDGFIEDPTNAVLIDTLTINTFTTIQDTVVTSQPSISQTIPYRFYSGRATNNANVETYCECYFRFDPPSEIEFNESAKFDSAVFIMYRDNYVYGDSTGIQTFTIHKLVDDIEVDEKSEYIFHLTQFASEEEPWLIMEIDGEEDDLEVRQKLSYEDGKVFYDMVYNKDSILSFEDKDYEEFYDKYKGFAVKPGDNVKYLMSIYANPDSTMSPRIRIYYSDNSINDDLYFDYALTGTTSSDLSGKLNKYASTYIKNDYSKSAFSGIEDNESFKFPSTESNNTSLVQGMLNLQTRIEIPYIDNLYDFGIGSVIKAVLEFEPVIDSYDDYYALPEELILTFVDDKNRVTGVLTQIENSEDLVTAQMNWKNKQNFDPLIDHPKYTMDVTRYLKEEYDSKGIQTNSLSLRFGSTSANSNFEYLLLGNKNHPTNPITLKLYMTFY